jgi:DNA mismatch repair protein MutL
MSRPSIRRLPAALRDQIAAGEVVERPASVVKELVENALDAGARTVRVEIEGGGLDRIAVTDDGHGMDAESAVLALERHATSKLAAFDDLYALKTYGFRGEALPSIASVSKLTLTTRTAEALAATEVVVEGASAPRLREIGAPQGTRVQVDELFFNVPARRKFTKSVATESAHVADVCLELALGRHDVALTLLRDGRLSRQFLRVDGRRARAVDAVGREGLAWIEAKRGAVSVEAWLCRPERARAGASGLHLVVNGRVVRDRALARAVAMAYGSLLEPGRYPVGVVWVDLPLGEVDVNVHPQKAEVRFARGRELFDDVTRALAANLAQSLRVPDDVRGRDRKTPEPGRVTPVPAMIAGLADAAVRSLSAPPTRSTQPPTVPSRLEQATPGEVEPDPWGLASDVAPTRIAARARTSDAPVEAFAPTEWLAGQAEVGTSKAAASAPPPVDPDAPPPLDASAQTAALAHGQRRETTLSSAQAVAFAEAARSSSTRGEIDYGALRFLAQSRATFLLCEGDDGLYVIDQHAAAERVSFARLRAQYRERRVVSQQLLVPEIVEVSAHEATLVDEIHDEVLALGLEAHAIGEGRVAVSAVPALLSRARPSDLLRDLLGEISRTGERRFGAAVDLVVATMACHGSVRAGEVLSRPECEALLRQLDEVDFAGYCPHGRPIVTMLSFSELEKKVGRR